MHSYTESKGDQQTVHENKKGRAALVHVIVALQTKYFGAKNMLKQLVSQAWVRKFDPANMSDGINSC